MGGQGAESKDSTPCDTPTPVAWPTLLLQIRLLELGLLLVGASIPELLELLHGHRVLRCGQVPLEIDDRVLAFGHFGPPSVGLRYWLVISASRCVKAPQQTKPMLFRLILIFLLFDEK